MGRTNPFLTNHVLSYYDAYTVSFGDNHRYYMRGQLTIMKNNIIMNNLWRKCYDLSHIGKRLKAFYKNADSSRRMHGWHFESAEGCISTIVAAEPDIRSITTNVLISDAFKAHTNEKESLMIGSTLLRCYGMPISSFSEVEIAPLLSTQW